MAQKRSHSQRDRTGKTNKRRKVNAAAANSSDESSKDFVDIDQLDWQTVTLPDRLEDAEGFYELEEIDGVDIVKEVGNGQIRFKVELPNSISAYTII